MQRIAALRSLDSLHKISYTFQVKANMELFFHDVGLKGAERDFPKTVFSSVPLQVVEEYAPEYLRAEMVETLRDTFPQGSFNAWGVPTGAKSVIKQLNVGDAMLLIRTTGGDGDIPALCIVDAYWKHQMLDLSQALWGSPRFPYIFFFDTEAISLTWTDFKEHVDYAPNFRPSGNVYRVRRDRLDRFGGVEGYLDYIREDEGSSPSTSYQSPRVSEPTPENEYLEGRRLTSERSYFRRNPKLVKQAKEHYGYSCQVCGFKFSDKYGEFGSNYIECHHLNPLSEHPDAEKSISTTIDDVRVVCSNCHRMLHRSRPALTIEELKSAIQDASV